jgi:uncharacterized membrane protein
LVVLNTVILRHRFDPYPFILLNLGLSCLAAQQGGALRIAANRGDRISSEVALHTYENGKQILTLNQQQMAVLNELTGLKSDVSGLGPAIQISPPHCTTNTTKETASHDHQGRRRQ